MPDDVRILGQIANPALTITGLDHVVLRVQSLERAIQFYGEVLGCPVERELQTPRLVQLRAGTSMIDLVPCGPDEPPVDVDGRAQHGALRGAHRQDGRAGADRASRAVTASTPARCAAATAPRATARRSTSPTRTATPSS